MLRRRAQRPTHSPADGGPPPDRSVVLDGVVAHRGQRVALRNVGFALRPGTLTAVIGPNGAGKSSLFGIISGRLQPTEGTVTTAGVVAEVLQSTQIDDELRMTVDDVVRLGRYPARGLLRPMMAGDRKILDESLAATNLSSLRRRSINELSGGQRQRALIAQGLTQQAPILLLDEPSAGLDRHSQHELLEILRTQATRGTTVVFATHDLDEAAQADNVIALSCECLCCAPPSTAMADPKVASLFSPRPGANLPSADMLTNQPVRTAEPLPEAI